MIFEKTHSFHKFTFSLDNVTLEQTKKRHLPRHKNMNTTGNFNKAVNDLRDKASRAFHAIKKNIKLEIPIKIWLKIFDAVMETIAPHGCEVWGPLANQALIKSDKQPILWTNHRSPKKNAQIMHAEQN